MVGRSVPEALRRGLTFWRRSIQARVVVSTVLLSAVVVVAVGLLLLRQVEHGLVDHRVQSILVEVNSENDQATQLLQAAPGTDTNAAQQAQDLMTGLETSGRARGFSVVMAGTPTDGARASSPLVVDSVPKSLEQHFADGKRTMAWTPTSIRTKSGQGTFEQVPGIAVGTVVVIPADGS